MFNFLLMLFVLLIYFFTHITEKRKKNNDKLFLVITMFFLSIIVGFRSFYSGNDTNTYTQIFKMCTIYRWNVLDILEYEKGYLIFNILISYISKSPRVFLIIVSCIFNFSIFQFVKKNSKNYLFSILIYIGLLLFYLSMTMFRQFLAMIIILYAYEFAKEKKFVLFFLFVCLATTIHTSAIIGLLIYPLCNCKFNKKRMFLITLVILITFTMLNDIINHVSVIFDRNILYEIRNNSISLANFLYAIVSGVFLFITLFFENKNKNYLIENDKYKYVFLLAMCFNILAMRMNVLSRAAHYFNILSIVAIPNVFEINILNKKFKNQIYSLLFIFLLTYSTTIIVLRPEWNSAYNYKFCTYEKSCSLSE